MTKARQVIRKMLKRVKKADLAQFTEDVLCQLFEDDQTGNFDVDKELDSDTNMNVMNTAMDMFPALQTEEMTEGKK